MYSASDASTGDGDGGGTLIMDEFNDRVQLSLLKL